MYSEKQNYFHNLNVKDLNDNNKFWKKIKAFFSDKGLAISTIVLKEKVNSITAYKKPAIFFNIDFIYTTYQYFSMKKMTDLKLKSLCEIIFYENHDNIYNIKERIIIPNKKIFPKKYYLMKLKTL